MSDEARRKQLGRGLSALFGDGGVAPGARGEAAPAQRAPLLVPIGRVHPSRVQPRKHFEPAEIAALAASIATQGVLQPILLRQHPDKPGEYELIAGERRWRAAQAAQLHEIPATVKDLSDREALEAALVENLQRQDLDALEEAAAFARLTGEFGHTQEAVAQALGKSRAYVANTIRLLSLPKDVQAMMRDGSLSAGHARAVLGAPDPLALAREIVKRKLTVREAEDLSRRAKAPPGNERTAPKSAPGRDADTAALERRLAAELGLKVTINHARGAQAGSIVFAYRSLDQLDELLARISGGGKR